MDIALRQTGNATIVDVNGDITLRTTPEVRKTLLGALRDKATQSLIVNMDNVRYIDSAGIASLVEALRVSRDSKKRFALFGVGKIAQQVLDLTRLTKVFEIHANEQEALAANGASGS